MTDISCPYCNAEQEICHDEGYGYEEDVTHEQECDQCERYFNFTTSVSYYYEASCRGDHEMSKWEPLGMPSVYLKARRECLRENCDHYEYQKSDD